MADTFVQLATDGSGKKMDTRTEGTNSEHRQVMVIGDPGTNAGVAPVDATKGLAVDLTATGANTTAILVTGTAGTFPVTDSGGSLTVDYATTGSGTATGALRVELPTNGTGVIATVGAVTAITNALPAGANAIGKLAANSGVDIGDVDVTTVGTITPGTAATSLGKAEDSAHSSGDVGVMALAVRNDAGSVLAGTDGDYHPLTTDATGALRVDNNGTVSTNNSSTATLLAAAVFTGTAEDALNYNEIRVSLIASHASATDGLSIQQSSDNSNWDFADTYTIAAATAKTFAVPRQARYVRVVYTNGGTNQSSFRLQTILNRVATMASSQRAADGYTNETDLEEMWAFNSLYNGTTWDRMRGDTTNGLDVDVTRVIPGTAATSLGKAEDAAHTTGDTGVFVLGVSNENLTAFAAASGDYVPVAHNRYGEHYITASPVSHATSNGTPITATTTSVIAAPSAGNHLRIVRIHISNGGATPTWIRLRDGAAGTQHYPVYYPQGGVYTSDLRQSGPLDLTSATRLDLVLTAAGSVEYEIDYQTVAD